jgi:hypothetical protein
MGVKPVREYDDAPIVLGRFVGGDKPFPTEISVPVTIAWEDRTQDYRLKPLLIRPHHLAEFTWGGDKPLVGFDQEWYEDAETVFEHPVDLGSGFTGYATDEIELGYSARMSGPVLAGLYRLNAGNAAQGSGIRPTPVVYQQAVWQLGTTPLGTLYAGECHLTRERLIEEPPEANHFPTAANLAKGVDYLISGCDGY